VSAQNLLLTKEWFAALLQQASDNFPLLFCFSMHVTRGIGLQKFQSSQILVISQQRVTQARDLTEQFSQTGTPLFMQL